MGQDSPVLWNLSSSLEELLDLNLAEARGRVKFRNELFVRLDELETEVKALKAKQGPAPQSNGHDAQAEGLFLKPSTLASLFKWLLPTLLVLLGELMHYAPGLFQKPSTPAQPPALSAPVTSASSQHH